MANTNTRGIQNNFDNVYIYVADALRLDYLSPDIQDKRGVTKTISSGTFSPPGFASLVTGRYPHEHGVYGFHNKLDSEIETIFSAFPGVNTGFCRGEGQVGEVIGGDHDVPTEPFELEEPFIVMERDLLTHVPYGKDQETVLPGSTEAYWKEIRADRSKLVADYERSARLSVDRFRARVDELEKRGLLDDTLVILTADHCETLGENGLVGHRHSITPEISYVPTVVYNEDANIQQDLIGHTDICPLIADAIGKSDQIPTDIQNRPMSQIADQEVYLTESIDMDSEAVWGKKGGYVFINEDSISRVKWMAVKMLISGARSYHRRRPMSIMRHGVAGIVSQPLVYGNPRFDEDTAKRVVETASKAQTGGKKRHISDDAKNRLRELGYMEEANK